MFQPLAILNVRQKGRPMDKNKFIVIPNKKHMYDRVLGAPEWFAPTN